MIFPFKTEDEAIHLANITDFGLSAAVWSRDLVRARRVAGEIESGMVFINDFTRSDPRAPFGGFKASGYGRTWRSRRTGTYQPKTDLAGCLNKSTRPECQLTPRDIDPVE